MNQIDEAIAAYEEELLVYATNQLKQIEGIEFVGKQRTKLLSFLST